MLGKQILISSLAKERLDRNKSKHKNILESKIRSVIHTILIVFLSISEIGDLKERYSILTGLQGCYSENLFSTSVISSSYISELPYL